MIAVTLPTYEPPILAVKEGFPERGVTIIFVNSEVSDISDLNARMFDQDR